MTRDEVITTVVKEFKAIVEAIDTNHVELEEFFLTDGATPELEAALIRQRALIEKTQHAMVEWVRWETEMESHTVGGNTILEAVS